MAFKFVTHLESNWDIYASDPLKQSKPKRMTNKILNRLKKKFDTIYYLEKRSENDHVSVLLNSLSEFLSRVNWKEEEEENKQETITKTFTTTRKTGKKSGHAQQWMGLWTKQLTSYQSDNNGYNHPSFNQHKNV